MNSKFIATAVVVIAGLSSGGAFAQNALYGEAALVVAPAISTSNVTRAQVESAYLQARQNGQVAVSNEAAFAFAPAASSNVSRAEVQADAVKARQEDGRSAS